MRDKHTYSRLTTQEHDDRIAKELRQQQEHDDFMMEQAVREASYEAQHQDFLIAQAERELSHDAFLMEQAEHEQPPALLLDEFLNNKTTASKAKLKKPRDDLPPYTRDQMHDVFHKWFGPDVDLDAVDAIAAAAASERLDGDPLWLMLISGPGAAKTESTQALTGAGAELISTITSEGALLSATKPRRKNQQATGGLLRKIGEYGVLVIKDFTSILSMQRDARAAVLAALREVYDGSWVRNVGSEGGQTLEWRGRIVVVAAVTTAWDAAHSVVASMGDRFVSLRIDSSRGRIASGRQAIRNTGHEVEMRAELAAAIGGLVLNASTDETELTEQEIERLLKAADIVTNARTAVERDYQGEVINAHAAEMPTRFAKQLTQLIRGSCAIGMTRKEAMRLAIRCARDSIPPLRLEILLDVALHPGSRPVDTRRRIGKPWRTVKRELEALTMLGLLECEEEEEEGDGDGKKKTAWLYSIAAGFDIKTLQSMAGGGPKSR